MKRSRVLLAFLLPLSLCCALCLTGCDDSDEDDTPAEKSSVIRNEAGQQNDTEQKTDSSTVSDKDADGDMVTLTDPNEGAFTVEMPRDWKTDVRLLRIADQNRSVGRAVSPDEETSLFFGNPRGPFYMEPTPQLPENSPVSQFNPMAQVRHYVPAEIYFVKHVKDKYGKLPGFHLIGTARAPGYEQVLDQQIQRLGMSLSHRTTTVVSFTYTAKGKTMNALIYGATMGTDTFWMTDVLGISSSGDPTRYSNTLFRIAGSYRTDPKWKEAEKIRSEQQMERSRQQHEQTMAQIRANGDAMTRAHNERMRAIQSAGAASTRAWQERQDRNDENHRRFIDSIRGESTVTTGGGGPTYKVDNSYDRYYVNPNDNTYIGTNSLTEQIDLGHIPGVNPNNYEEAHIKP